MNHRSLSLPGTLRSALLGSLPLAAAAWLIPAHAQSTDQPAAAAQANSSETVWTMPRTRDGRPDLEGIWTNKTVTPFERPQSLGNKAFFTPEEAKKFTEQALARSNKDRRTEGVRDVLNAYNAFWWDSGTKVLPNMRTSIVTDPPDGRIPPLTPERQAELQQEQQAIKERCRHPGCAITNAGQLAPADSAKVLDLETRCISLGTVVPMLPTAYNNNYQIVQSPGVVAIDTEMVHDVRRIPTNGSSHLPASVREWFGDPRGHWEGDTLVVDSTNFNGQMYGRLRVADKNLHVTERFKLVGPNTLLYQFTVEDPTVYTEPWSGEIPLTRISGLLYEYACHEGNIGLRDIIRAAREDEQKAAEKTSAAVSD
ncbi:MAG TPA: hypothetical protein VFY39_11705 [Gammaproteobacteria bacterium]|nr:hypothetical protein [Gammaproteobacteria bacterium]